MIDKTHRATLDRQWREKFPLTLSKLFAFYQFLCTIAIIGCEVGSILIDIFHATIYVGFWAGLIFMVAWISQTISVSCRLTYRCATYTFIIQCITLLFAACVIAFDAYFIINPTVCLFSITLCNSTGTARGIFYSEGNFNDVKIPLIKGQLATAAVMLAFCIDYIIIYMVTRSHIKKNITPITKLPNNSFNNFNNTSFNNTSFNTINRIPTTSARTGVLNTSVNTVNATPLLGTDRINYSGVDISLLSSVPTLQQSRWSFDLNPIDI